MDEWTNVMYLSNRLHCNKNKRSTDTFNDANESQKHYAKLKKPDQKEIQCDESIYKNDKKR